MIAFSNRVLGIPFNEPKPNWDLHRKSFILVTFHLYCVCVHVYLYVYLFIHLFTHL